MKNYILILSCVLFVSCKQLSPNEKIIKKTLKKSVNLKMFKNVIVGDEVVTYQSIRSKYDYISVVYFKDGCFSCYPKFVEWHNKMDSIGIPDSYTMLFIIMGKSYPEFISKVHQIDYIYNKYPIIMDSNSQFLESNIDIPFDIFNSSVLIDKENKIQLIGAPYVTTQMRELFFEIVGASSLPK